MHTEHLSIGDVITVRHYSGVSPFKTVVMNVSTDIMVIKITKDFAIRNFLEGDPVVFGYEKDGEVHIFGSTISKINLSESIIELYVDKVETGADKRQYERYPVSLYADIRTRGSRERKLGVIKDISYYGMKVYSKLDIEVKSELEVDIYMDKNMVFLKTNVMRKAECTNYFEYGLSIVYEDTKSLNYMKEYVKRLMMEQEEAIRKLRNNR